MPPNPIIKTTWTFAHSPSPAGPLTTPSNSHNTRSSTLSFRTPHHGLLHGLAGYFTAVLYTSPSPSTATVEITTNPLTMLSKSPNMISWFPIFFPLKQPLWVPDNGEVEVGMWRCTDGRRVWYEWVVEVWRWEGWGSTSSDEGGKEKEREHLRDRKRRVRVGMSEVHSSAKGACLM